MGNKEKNIILFVGNINKDHIKSVHELEKILGRNLKIAVLLGIKKKLKPEIKNEIDLQINCNLKKKSAIEESLVKYRDKILGIAAKYEYSIELLSRIVPIFPYLRLPNARSLKVANDKLEMRKAFKNYYPKITPKFIKVKKYSDKLIKDISKELGFPCVIKPTNLSKSHLIINCFYKEELEKNLKEVLKKIKALYKRAEVEIEPKVIVEEFMEGRMYTIDAYVNSFGKLFYTPMIEVKTGKDAGYDDLFMYTQITPADIAKEDEEKCRDVVEKATHAVGLRSSTVHCELMKTSKGWKVIELGARPGGFREELLYHSFGIKHHLNDLMIKVGKKPIIKKKIKKNVVFMKFWPKKPGKLIAIKGLQKAKALKSLVRFRQGKQIGDYAGLSKHGHTFVVTFTLARKTRSDLMGDLRKLEKWIQIETSRNGKKKKKSKTVKNEVKVLKESPNKKKKQTS